MTVPGYWTNEQSGVLAPVVMRYLAGYWLNAEELGIMRGYLRQWMRGNFGGPIAAELRVSLDEITDTASLRAWLDLALEAGVDPL